MLVLQKGKTSLLMQHFRDPETFQYFARKGAGSRQKISMFQAKLASHYTSTDPLHTYPQKRCWMVMRALLAKNMLGAFIEHLDMFVAWGIESLNKRVSATQNGGKNMIIYISAKFLSPCWDR